MSISMKRLVYLFELDSVRNSEKEVAIGQKALFEEITILGHAVAISLNQLGDSKVFMSLVNNKKAYENILQLFDVGAIKVSLFGELKSVSEYVQRSLEKPDFVFSNLPLNVGGNDLREDVKEALRFSSLLRLEELRDKQENIVDKEKYEYIIRYISLLLHISKTNVYIPAKTKEEIKDLVDFIERVRKCGKTEYFKNNFTKTGIKYTQFVAAMTNLETVQSVLPVEKWLLRSEWLKVIHASGETDIQELTLAILHLCYNYTVESNISGVTPHYTEDVEEDFIDDFICRLKESWTMHQMGGHTFYQKSSENRFGVSINECPEPWNNAVRIISPPEIGYSGKRKGKKEVAVAESVEFKSYEAAYCEDKKRWTQHRRKTLLARIGTAFFYGFVFWVYSECMDMCNFDKFGWLFEAFFGTILLGLLSSVLMTLFKIPDILESFQYLYWAIADACVLYFKAPKNVAYKNNEKLRGSKDEN